MAQATLLLLCLTGFILVVLLQSVLVHRMGRLRYRAAEEKKRYAKVRSIGAGLTEEVVQLDRGIKSQEVTLHKLEEEIGELKRQLEVEEIEPHEKSVVPSSFETKGNREI